MCLTSEFTGCDLVFQIIQLASFAAGFNEGRTSRVPFRLLDLGPIQVDNNLVPCGGRTGFDFADTPEAACRGWFVGLVKNRTEKLTANEELALAA